MTEIGAAVRKHVNKKSCSVPNCDGAQAKGVFHKFPTDESVKRQWVETCNITKAVNSNMYVCGVHFSQEDYSCLKPKRLRRYIVPSRMLVQNDLDFEEFEPEKQNNVKFSNFHEVDISSHGSQDIDTAVLQLEGIESISPTNAIKKTCCVPQCNATQSDGTFFHSFPKLKKIYHEWFLACNLSEPLKHPLYVCNAHFCKEDYLNLSSTKLVLKSAAVPSLNLDKKPKFKVVIREENNEASSTKDGKNKEKVTTIIYVPKNNKSIITSDFDQVKVIKAQDKKSNSVQKKISRVLQTHNPMKIVNRQKKIIDIQQKKVTVKRLNNVTIKRISNVKNQSNVVQQKQQKDIEKQQSTGNIVQQIQYKNIEKQQNKSNIYKQNKHDESEISSVNINNDFGFQETHSNTSVKKPETVNIIIEKQVKKNTVSRVYAANEQIKKSVSAITLCAGCSQYTNIDDEDLTDIRKTPETLAAEALLELQEVNPPNEDERTVITKKGIEICDRVIQKKIFNVIDLLTSDLELMAFTGINLSLLERLTKAVTIAEGPKSTAKIRHPPRERIVLCLCKLRTNLTFRSLAVIFGVTQILCSSYFFAMVRTLAGILQHIIHWSKTEELLKNLPKAFQSFKQTRVILNCTETQIEKQRCPKCKKELIEKKKDYESVKFVLGVAPNGLIIFNSKIYDAQAEDTSIFTQTTLLNNLDPVKEAIMADKSLNIEAECIERNITLIKAPKLEKNKQYSSSDVELIKNVCAARVHVDRTLQRFKMYKILQTKISWRVLPYLNDVCTVVAGIINLKNPILPDDVLLTQAGLKF